MIGPCSPTLLGCIHVRVFLSDFIEQINDDDDDDDVETY